MSDQPTHELIAVRRGPLRAVIGLLLLSVLAAIALTILVIINGSTDASQADVDQIKKVVCNGTVVIPADRRVLDSQSADRLVKLCGEKGPSGQAGDTGSAGPTGPAGSSGSDGHDGAAGHPGQTGATGQQGPQGQRGPVGPRGQRGLHGRRGKRGQPGRDGQPAPGLPQVSQEIHELQQTVVALSGTVDSISNLLCRLLSCP